MNTASDLTSNQPTAEMFAPQVAEVFQEVLGGDAPVNGESDFFELGGNSMLGARLVARLRQVFDVKVTIRDVFRARTVDGVAEAVAVRTAQG
ncbi:acyl carrier protein [Kitasatospora acidiphila]|uniref:Acyl carrier protein n=1 Tax=Kitasatospora acidiphila TaxID=2567942 RepID=A0A540VXQ9_9ACTN|nr:phosphopantetheine-binding protein [Kitasatospora acidiphila]TQF01543.1 acyl carrier protein [Kitasatospora acidiphila]